MAALMFTDILKTDLSPDEEIDLVVATWTDEDDIEKGNPYHDERGRFATAPGGGNPMIRTAPPPKNTKIAYKVIVAKDGKLYPPMVANPDGAATPVGVWLDASEGKLATDKDGNPITNTLGRNKVQAGGKGTQGGSGTLAYRPGWHLGEVPEAKQFYTKDKKTGEKLQKKNFVWAECEIAADFDYQTEAMSYGYNKNGKFQHSLAGLPKIPTDGYYTYRTNPDPTTKPWYITGSMKVNRILTDAETNQILRSHGIEPMKRQGGELDLKALGFTQTDFTSVDKSERIGKTFDDILKFNPYHDARGRFSTSDAATSFTYAPGKSKAHDMAIAREKERHAAAMANPTNDPEVIAGVKRGPAMTHEQADEGRANPKFASADRSAMDEAEKKMYECDRKYQAAIRDGASNEEKTAILKESEEATRAYDKEVKKYNQAIRDNRPYRENCQTCVVAYEARLRGYDVEAKPRDKYNMTQNRLERNPNSAWMNPNTGKIASSAENSPSINTQKKMTQWVEQNVETGARYTFEHGWKGTDGRIGHIVSISRDKNNSLCIFDPQSGKTYVGDDFNAYMGRVKGTWNNGLGTQGRLEITRVDNMQINGSVANAVLKGAGQ